MTIITNVKKVIDYLTSRNFALILLGTLTIFSLIGVTIPQDTQAALQTDVSWFNRYPNLVQFARTLGLTYVFTSPFFMVVSLVLFTSMLLCTWRQAKFTRRLIKSLPTSNHPTHPHTDLGQLGPGVELEDVADLLSANGYDGFIDEEKNIIRAHKHIFGYWGSVVLHLGFVLILLGVLLSSFTKMEGFMFLGEGQTLPEEARSYFDLKESKLFPNHKGFSLRLDKLDITYPDNEIPYLNTVTLTVQDGNKQTTQELQRGRFLKYGGIKFLPYVRGYAVGLVITDEKNRELGGGFYHLTTRWHDPGVNPREVIDKNADEVYADTISLPNFGITLNVKFIPDYELKQGIMSRKSFKPNNPGLELEVTKENQVLYTGPLKLGDKVKIGDKLLHFPVYRNNITLQAVSDQGTPVIFSGFAISLLGLLLLYIFNPRQLWLQIQPDANVIVWGRSYKFPSMFQEELITLTQTIKDNVTEGELHDV